MGIVITYEGCLDDAGRVNELIQDFKLRCRKLEWRCEEVNERILGEAYYFMGQTEEVGEDGRTKVVDHVDLRAVDDRIRGVFIQPPKLGTLILTFDRAGTLIYYRALRGQITSTETPLGTAMGFTEEPGYYMAARQNWIKTTGQIDTHVLIVAFLRYLQKTYMSNLEVDDPTEYWESQDMDNLYSEHASMSFILDFFRQPDAMKSLLQIAGFEDVEEIKPVPPEELTLRLEKPEHMKNWGISAHEN